MPKTIEVPDDAEVIVIRPGRRPPRAKVATPQPVTYVGLLLDRSGSMAALKDATIEAVNAYVAGLAGAGVRFTLAQFDSNGIHHTGGLSMDWSALDVDPQRFTPLTQATYMPRGGTPLVDAAWSMIDFLERRSHHSGSKIVCAIQTDGEENSSTKHTTQELKGRIETLQARGWQFLFMGAGIDAYHQAQAFGIARGGTVSYSANVIGTRNAFAASSANTASYAGGQSVNANYSSRQKRMAGDLSEEVNASTDTWGELNPDLDVVQTTIKPDEA